MDQIISLIQDRNLHLEKFAQIGEKELLNFAEGNFDDLEEFYRVREGILHMVACIDQLIESTEGKLAYAWSPTPEDRHLIQFELQRKAEIVNRILSQDLQILSLIESVKSQIIKDLSQVTAGRKALQSYRGYKSPNRLDEEA